ncbi:hypothetical protein BC834DRAFT_636181 [Gloeopeniophorella convolvens]|nr:hypothetical protein BC834DRAFT_636181 [Gloeopeniophorella convolvens]
MVHLDSMRPSSASHTTVRFWCWTIGSETEYIRPWDVEALPRCSCRDLTFTGQWHALSPSAETGEERGRYDAIKRRMTRWRSLELSLPRDGVGKYTWVRCGVIDLSDAIRRSCKTLGRPETFGSAFFRERSPRDVRNIYGEAVLKGPTPRASTGAMEGTKPCIHYRPRPEYPWHFRSAPEVTGNKSAIMSSTWSV